jgi:plastocyanin
MIKFRSIKFRSIKFRSIKIRSALAVTVLILIAACSGSSSSYSTTTSPTSGTGGTGAVTITAVTYSPNSLTVSQGSTVTWTNSDVGPHTVTSDGGLFNSGSIAPGGKYSYTFPSTGTFPYHCTIHPNMVGTIVVQ